MAEVGRKELFNVKVHYGAVGCFAALTLCAALERRWIMAGASGAICLFAWLVASASMRGLISLVYRLMYQTRDEAMHIQLSGLPHQYQLSGSDWAHSRFVCQACQHEVKIHDHDLTRDMGELEINVILQCPNANRSEQGEFV
jgi:hypothetical protein